MRISDWSSDVCSSDLDAKDLVYVRIDRRRKLPATTLLLALDSAATEKLRAERAAEGKALEPHEAQGMTPEDVLDFFYDKITYKRSGNGWATPFDADRSEEHTSELQYLMRNPYAGFCVKEKNEQTQQPQ